MEWDKIVKPVLLVGGQSSRMGSRKELKAFPDGRPAYQHALQTLNSALPFASTIYISLRDETQAAAIEYLRMESPELPPPPSPPNIESVHDDTDDHELPRPRLEVLYDDTSVGDIGPAAALLSAHAHDPSATYLFLACDHPLLPPTALQQLILEYEPPLTCFKNEQGFHEPLIAIWSPEALEELKKRVTSGSGSGLNRVIKTMEAKAVTPLREEWLRGANDQNEWAEAMEILRV
jgi:molybdopterin-guanine dinucleotide biosynthesis protein A